MRSRRKALRSPSRAPGSLRTVQAFVNTLDRKAGEDRLTSPKAVAGWLTKARLLATDAEVGEDELRRALEMREILRALLAANNGAEINAKVAERLDEIAGETRHKVRFSSRGVARLEPVVWTFDGSLGRMVEIVVVSQSSGLWRNLKVCADVDCLTAFYDISRNHSGRWCTKRCGNRQNARAFRRRGGRPSRRGVPDWLVPLEEITEGLEECVRRGQRERFAKEQLAKAGPGDRD